MPRPKTEAGKRYRDIHITLPPELAQEIDARGAVRSEVVRRDLERLYTLYKHALRDISLSVNEACLIADALNGALVDANSAALLWAEIGDAIRVHGLDRKWNVDGQALVEKLRGLDRLTCLALVDAAERFWHECPHGDLGQVIRRFFPARE